MSPGAWGLRRLAWPDLAAVALLCVLVPVLFGGQLAGSWRGDDPAILWHAMNAPGLSAFTDPEVWRRLSPSNLTPWLTLGFKLDLALGGPDPKVFYAHQLLSLAAVLVAGYALARQAMPVPWALLAMLLFLGGSPVPAVVSSLASRHYIEGLAWALLAVLAFRRALAGGRAVWLVPATGAYALAMTAKEVYVPLILVFAALLPGTGGRSAWMRLLPLAGALLAYLLWRRFMLGETVGGYAGAPSYLTAESIAALVRALGAMPGRFFGAVGPGLVVLLLAAAVAACMQRPARLVLFAALALGLVAPLLPLAVFPGLEGPSRYTWALWFVLCLGGVWGLQLAAARVPWRRAAQGGLALLLLGMIVLAQHQAGLEDRARRMHDAQYDAAGRWLLQASPRTAYVPPPAIAANFWFHSSLCEILRARGQGCPTPLIRGVPLAASVDRAYVFDAVHARMVERPDPDGRWLRELAAADTTRPLSVLIEVGEAWTRWRLGPHTDGQWFLASPEMGRYPVPPSGQARVSAPESRVYVQFESAQGELTRSDELLVIRGQVLEWRR